MATKTRRQLIEEISDLCEQAGCNEKIAQIHQTQFVDRQWNPHPPRSFVQWWATDARKEAEKITGRAWTHIDATRAFNCASIRDVFYSQSF